MAPVQLARVRWPWRKPLCLPLSLQVVIAAAATLRGSIRAGHAKGDVACIARDSAQPVARSEQQMARSECDAASGALRRCALMRAESPCAVGIDRGLELLDVSETAFVEKQERPCGNDDHDESCC